MNFKQQSTQTTSKVVAVIKSRIAIGGHSATGAPNLLKVGEAAGIKNVGTVISRPGISFAMLFRIIYAVESLLPETHRAAFRNEISEALKG